MSSGQALAILGLTPLDQIFDEFSTIFRYIIFSLRSSSTMDLAKTRDSVSQLVSYLFSYFQHIDYRLFQDYFFHKNPWNCVGRSMFCPLHGSLVLHEPNVI